MGAAERRSRLCLGHGTNAGDKPELDEALRLALRNLPAVREGAPGDMPQPIRLRITTRS